MRPLSIIEQRIEWTRLERATDKTVLKAIARWFAYRPDGTHIRFTVATLAAKSGVPKRSVERALDRLEADWYLEITTRAHRRPTTYRIVLERLATSDPDALKVADPACASPPEWRTNGGFDRQSGGQESEWRTRNGPDFEKVADQRSEEEVRTNTSTGTPPPAEEVRQSGGQHRPEHPDVPRFLAWAIETYPQHAHGAHLVLHRERDGHLVHGLLEHYPLERLQAMTVQCWTLEADSDPMSHASWIARSDRSLRVLRHKAAFLERLAVGAQQLTLGPLMERPLSQREVQDATYALTHVYGRCPHEPRHTQFTDCVREIALARRVV